MRSTSRAVARCLGLDLGEVESGGFWVEFLRSLRARALAGVRLGVSDHHEGLKAAIERVLGCPWQRCTGVTLTIGRCPPASLARATPSRPFTTWVARPARTGPGRAARARDGRLSVAGA